METTESYITVLDLKPGMTFQHPQTKERWRLIRCPETGECVPGVNGPLPNDRRCKWLAAPVDNLSNEGLFCFDDRMLITTFQWEDPAPDLTAQFEMALCKQCGREFKRKAGIHNPKQFCGHPNCLRDRRLLKQKPVSIDDPNYVKNKEHWDYYNAVLKDTYDE